MKRNPHDPDGEYERESYNLNRFCAEEGASYDAAREWYDFVPPNECGNTPDKRGNEPPSVTTITDLAHEVLDQREIVGGATYNRPLLHSYKTFLQWLDDAIEESADQLQYLVAAREAFKDYVRREGLNDD